jgi:phenylacetate-CoA ligase
MADHSHPDRAAIEARQLEQLHSLVAELFPSNDFYTKKLQAVGVTFDVASLADFSKRFPFTTKAEIAADQAANPPFGTNLTYPLDCYTRFHHTSGTTGSPIRWLDTPETWEAMVETWAEIFHTADLGFGDRVMFAFSFGPFLGFWLAFEAAEHLDYLCVPGGGLSSAARLQLLRDTKCNVLCCTPTYAMRLAEVAAEEKISIADLGVKRIIVAGEPGGSVPATRARIESLWSGARVFDHHGMTEVGPVSYECPAQPGVLHIIESAYIAEVIDPATGKATSDGELVLTTLTRTGSPLLRYRTGDLVKCEVGGKCKCGRSEMRLIGGILGRTDDMVIVRGVNVYPTAVEDIVRGCGGVAEYRVNLRQPQGLAEIELEIECLPEANDGTALAEKVSRAFETGLSLRVPVKSVPPGTLPRFEMKAKRWVKTP